MHLERVPAEAAAWAVGISTKNILTLTRRGILKAREIQALGPKKHAYVYGWDEVCFLGVLVAFQKQFSILYRASLRWKKPIQDAMRKNARFLTITNDGGVEALSYPTGTAARGNELDIEKFTNYNVVVFLNIQKLRRDLVEKLNTWK